MAGSLGDWSCALAAGAAAVVVVVTPADAAHRRAGASTLGSLSQRSGRQGCVADRGRHRCARGRGLDGANSVSQWPDGRNVYVASTNAFPEPSSLGDSVAVFRRGGPRGALEPLAASAGCINRKATGGCARGRALDVLESVSVSPEGRNVYVTAAGRRGGVAVFARDAASGALTQLA